jgi:Glycerophosphoryl diester phosphodiesterase family
MNALLNRQLVWTLFATFALLLGSAQVHAQEGGTCDATRSGYPTVGANYNLSKLVGTLKTPPNPLSLILVTAHRGNWQYCPENSIEAFYSALALNAEAAEMDVRLTQDNECILTHDYNTRGEFPNNPPGTQGNFFIPSLLESSLRGLPMVDRFGYPAADSMGNDVVELTFADLLDAYKVYIGRISGGIVSGVATRGALLVIDIKGGDIVGGTDQGGYAALKSCYSTLYSWETSNKVDLSPGVMFKLPYKQMTCVTGQTTPCTAQQFSTLVGQGLTFPTYNGHGPKLGFIVYPADLMETPTQPWSTSDTTFPFNGWRKRSAYQDYIITNYQSRYPGISADSFVADEQANGRGLSAFIANNSYPEGYRLSGGTCAPQYTALACANQPLQTYASATPEYIVPPKSFGKPLATNITTDWFQQEAAYLTTLGYRNISIIQ